MYNYNNTAGNEDCNKSLDLPLVAKCTNPELLSTFVWPLSISSVLGISKREPWTDVGSCCGIHAAPMLKASWRGDPIMVKVELYWCAQLVYPSSSTFFILIVIFLILCCLFVFPAPLFLLCASLVWQITDKLPHLFQFSSFSPLVSCCGTVQTYPHLYSATYTSVPFPFFPYFWLPLWGSLLLPLSRASHIDLTNFPPLSNAELSFFASSSLLMHPHCCSDFHCRLFFLLYVPPFISGSLCNLLILL